MAKELNELYAYLVETEDGKEGILQGDELMIAASMTKVQALRPFVEQFVMSQGATVKLVKFGPRTVIEEIGLQTRDPVPDRFRGGQRAPSNTVRAATR